MLVESPWLQWRSAPSVAQGPQQLDILDRVPFMQLMTTTHSIPVLNENLQFFKIYFPGVYSTVPHTR